MLKSHKRQIGILFLALKEKQILKSLGSVFLYGILVLGIIVTLMPFIWMISTSLKAETEIFQYPPKFIPQKIYLRNYLDAWQAAPFGRYLMNSMIQSIAVTLSVIVTSSLAGYAFARMRFWGRDVIFLVYLGTIMIPKQVTLVPAFVITQFLGWVDTYFGLIVPEIATAFGVFLLRQFFLTIPKSLEDAAVIDGCKHLGILFRIFLPLSKPALATLGLITFMRTWNSFFWPLIITNSKYMRTLQVGLRYFIDLEGGINWNLLMAAAVIVTIPVLIVFILAQKQFIEGIALSGIKG